MDERDYISRVEIIRKSCSSQTHASVRALEMQARVLGCVRGLRHEVIIYAHDKGQSHHHSYMYVHANPRRTLLLT